MSGEQLTINDPGLFEQRMSALNLTHILCLSLIVILVKTDQELFSIGQKALLKPDLIDLSPKDQGNYLHHRGGHRFRHAHRELNSEQANEEGLPVPSNVLPIDSTVNKLLGKNGQIEGSNNLKMLAELKGSADFNTKSATKYTETIEERNHNNDTKRTTKVLDQKNESYSTIKDRSGAEVHNNKTIKAHFDQGPNSNNDKLLDENATLSDDMFKHMHDQAMKLRRLQSDDQEDKDKKEKDKEERKNERRAKKEERKRKRKERKEARKNKQNKTQTHATTNSPGTNAP